MPAPADRRAPRPRRAPSSQRPPRPPCSDLDAPRWVAPGFGLDDLPDLLDGVVGMIGMVHDRVVVVAGGGHLGFRVVPAQRELLAVLGSTVGKPLIQI